MAQLNVQRPANLAAKRLQESVQKENENLKAIIESLKNERDESQQKWLVLEQITRHKKIEGIALTYSCFERGEILSF